MSTAEEKNQERTERDRIEIGEEWEERQKYELPQHNSNGFNNDCG
jgi:hypothetical protein